MQNINGARGGGTPRQEAKGKEARGEPIINRKTGGVNIQ